MSPWTSCCFVSGGTIQIYGIRDDGGISPIGLARSPAILGDVEFGNGGKSPFFSQAKTNALCLALSTREYSEQLHRDLRFLHCLLRFYGEKLERFSTQSVTGTTVEQRGAAILGKRGCPGGAYGDGKRYLAAALQPPAVAAGAEKTVPAGENRKGWGKAATALPRMVKAIKGMGCCFPGMSSAHFARVFAISRLPPQGAKNPWPFQGPGIFHGISHCFSGFCGPLFRHSASTAAAKAPVSFATSTGAAWWAPR